MTHRDFRIRRKQDERTIDEAMRRHPEETFDGALIAEVQRLRAECDALREQYNDLLMQVATKHPDETRHETARRYIQQAENRPAEPAQVALRGEG